MRQVQQRSIGERSRLCRGLSRRCIEALPVRDREPAFIERADIIARSSLDKVAGGDRKTCACATTHAPASGDEIQVQLVSTDPCALQMHQPPKHRMPRTLQLTAPQSRYGSREPREDRLFTGPNTDLQDLDCPGDHFLWSLYE